MKLVKCIYSDTEKCPNFSCRHASLHEIDPLKHSCETWDDCGVWHPNGIYNINSVRCVGVSIEEIL